MPRQIKRYGWVPDIPDHRDVLYAAPMAVTQKLPTKVDLRKKCPPVYDQGQLGSCTANAIAGAIEFDQLKQKLSTTFTPSRLFIYYNERVMMGPDYVNVDSGAQIRDGVKSVATDGAPPETMWPYVIAKFATKPPDAAYSEAKNHTISSYQRLVRTLTPVQGLPGLGLPLRLRLHGL